MGWIGFLAVGLVLVGLSARAQDADIVLTPVDEARCRPVDLNSLPAFWTCVETPFGALGYFYNGHAHYSLEFFPAGFDASDYDGYRAPQHPFGTRGLGSILDDPRVNSDGVSQPDADYDVYHSSAGKWSTYQGALTYVVSVRGHSIAPYAFDGQPGNLTLYETTLSVFGADGLMIELAFTGSHETSWPQVSVIIEEFERQNIPRPLAEPAVRECFSQDQVEAESYSFAEVPLESLDQGYEQGDLTPRITWRRAGYLLWLGYEAPGASGFGSAWIQGDSLNLAVRSAIDEGTGPIYASSRQYLDLTRPNSAPTFNCGTNDVVAQALMAEALTIFDAD